MGLLVMMFGYAKAILMFFVGRKLRKLENRSLCIAGAAIACVFVPFGTLLGVFTIITLSKDSVRGLFEAREPLDSL